MTRNKRCAVPLLCLLLCLLAGCASLGQDYDNPVVDVVGLRPLPTTGLDVRFEISLRVVNPNPVALELEGIYYELHVEDSRLLSGASDEHHSVPAYGEAIIKVPASASLMGSFQLLRKLMGAPPENGIAYKLKAKISVRGWPLSVPIEREGRIGDKSPAQVST